MITAVIAHELFINRLLPRFDPPRHSLLTTDIWDKEGYLKEGEYKVKRQVRYWEKIFATYLTNFAYPE